jgi:ATP-dependent exoDNAse (exonuclease V) beta subunit
MAFAPTPQQARVIESTENDILVEAGAGSGKTTTMVNRYVNLLAEREYEPREILAFTFTDKAAGELREKVRKARQQLAVNEGDANPASVSMSDAWVGTFHAICNRILKAWPVEAGIDPRFGVIDDVTAETVRNAAFRDALMTFRDEVEDPAPRESMIGTITERTLRGTVISAYDELRSRGIGDPRLPAFEPTPYPEEEIRRLAGIVPGLFDVKGATQVQKDKLAGILDLLAGDFRCEDLAPLAFGSTREGFREFCELMPELVGKLAAHEFGDEFRRDLGRLLELFGRQYRRHKERRSILDYEDLQLLTVNLLRGTPRIRDAYRERFREIMVDEFQDTNQLQLDLVGLLRGEETTLVTVGDEMQSIYGFRHADVELFRARRNQSGIAVYRLTDNFRSQPRIIAAVNLIGGELDRQVNAVRGNDKVSGRHRFAELTIGLEADRESSAEVVMTERGGWKPLDLGSLAPAISEDAEIGKDVDHFNEAEALDLAHRLKALVDSGEVRQKDIAILLRARTRATLYMSALKQVGLDPYLSGGTGFWEAREAVDIRALLSIVANPLDDEPMLTVLASPISGLSADALWILGQAGSPNRSIWENLQDSIGGGQLKVEESPVTLSEEDRLRAAGLVDLVGRLRTAATAVSLAVLVETCVAESRYDLASLSGDRSGNGLAVVRRIASLAREYETAEGRSLRGFLDWVSLSADLDSESAVATVEEDSDVIRIMTIHAAKGLEFGVVCVPDCGRSSANRHNYPLLMGRPGSGSPGAAPGEDFAVGMRLKMVGGTSVEMYDWPALKSQAGLRLEDEELRLFHVALTRARERLVISGVPPMKIPKPKTEGPTPSRSMIQRICENFDLKPEDFDSWPPGIGEEPGESILDLLVNRATPEAAEALAGRETATSSPVEGEVVSPPLARPRFKVFPNIPLSFTALTEFTDCPARFYARRVLGMSNESERFSVAPGEDPESGNLLERDRATEFGVSVHEALENLGRKGWPSSIEAEIKSALARHGLTTPENLERATGMVAHFLGSELGARVRERNAAFEVPLLLSIEGITIRGFVDVLIDGAPPLIIDYKTNRLDGQPPSAKMDKYGVQRDLYALALARAGHREAVDTAFVFLERAADPVLDRLETADLELAEAKLQEDLREIVEGRFFGGGSAGRQPCGECWACRDLSAQIERSAAA